MAYRGLITRNEEEQLFVNCITKGHKFLNEKLGLDSKLEFGRTAVWGKNAHHAGLYFHETNEVLLNFRNLYGHNMRTFLEVLGHEVRHAYQKQQGWFGDNPPKSQGYGKSRYEYGMWCGRRIYDKYENLPWEIDARKYEKVYAQLIINSGILTDKELSSVMSGAKRYRVLENETKRELTKLKPNGYFFRSYLETSDEFKKRCDDNNKEIEKLGFELKGNRWEYVGKTTDKDTAFKKLKKMTLNPQRKEDGEGIYCIELTDLPKQYKYWNEDTKRYVFSNLEKLKNCYYKYHKQDTTIDDLVS